MSDQNRLYCKDPDGMYDAVAEYENGSFVVKAGSRIFRHVRTEELVAQYENAVGKGNVLIKDISFTFEKRATRFVTGGILKDNAWFTADGRSAENVKNGVPGSSLADAAPSAASEMSQLDDSISKLLDEFADGLNDSWDLVTPVSAAQPILDRHTCIKHLEGIRNYLKGMRYLLHKNKAMAIAAFEEAAAFEHPDAMFMLAMNNHDVEMLRKASALNYAPALVQLAIEHTEDGSEAQNLLYKAASAQYVSQNAPADADTSFIWEFLDDLDDDKVVDQNRDESDPLVRQMSLNDENTDYDGIEDIFIKAWNNTTDHSLKMQAEILRNALGDFIVNRTKIGSIYQKLGYSNAYGAALFSRDGRFIQISKGYWMAKDAADRLGYVEARESLNDNVKAQETIANTNAVSAAYQYDLDILDKQKRLNDQNTDYDGIVSDLKRLLTQKENKQIRYSDSEIVAMSCGSKVISTAKLKSIYKNLGKNTSSVNSLLNQSGSFIQVSRGYWMAKDVADRLGYVDARKNAEKETIGNRQTVSNSIKQYQTVSNSIKQYQTVSNSIKQYQCFQ